jgi:hypothetical protein
VSPIQLHGVSSAGSGRWRSSSRSRGLLIGPASARWHVPVPAGHRNAPLRIASWRERPRGRRWLERSGE